MFQVQEKYRRCKSKNDKKKKWHKKKCAVCSNEKSRFMREQEAKGLLNSLGIKVPMSNIPLLGNILF